MASCSLGLTMMVALLTVQAAPPPSPNDTFLHGSFTPWVPAEAVPRDKGEGEVVTLPADHGQVSVVGWQPIGTSQPPPRMPRLPAGSRGQPDPPSAIQGGISRERPIRLPRTQRPTEAGRRPLVEVVPPSGQPIDGTWREEDGYVILNLHGQEMRLVKAPSAQHHTAASEGSGGTVSGRLLHKGRPLVNCRVALSFLTKRFTGYRVDRSAEPLRAVTNAQGEYRFENVPAGPYKLSWMPEGTNQWIRRVKMKPDLTVQNDQTRRVKDISAALRTMN